ncbi:MutS-related protein [Anaeromicropila herbilytica]|uniref:DNA mismatch repair protein MutS n=1 Tax=Anaeromicropila herbilytica TaxID=2785025 RepID=A0A7R7EM37_9FIRM|nr:hypothetical protein [Anaeromicropila herbilytica]BCN31302.1 DNA mismatch repair protein MutS [Anaeromicropila herbilytica]
MEYLIIIGIGLLLLFIKNIYDEKASKERALIKLKKEWGQVPDEEYTSEKFEALKWFYNTKKDQYDIDDITWSDLDMDQIYMLMNNTSSALGEEYLYSLLRKVKYTIEPLKERNEVIRFFETNAEKRIQMQSTFSKMGKVKKLSVFEYLDRVNQLKKRTNIPHILMASGLILSLISAFIIGAASVAPIIIFLALNIIRYYKYKAEIEPYITVFSYIVKLLDSVDEMRKIDAPELQKYKDELESSMKKFHSFRKRTFLLSSGNNMSGDLSELIIDYVRILFHVDLIKFNNMLYLVQKNKKELFAMFETMGFLDSMIAVASFRTMMGQTVEPILVKGKKPILSVEDVYHPLIDEPIMNSINTEQCVLITGSNASGKSTFLRTMAINAVLSQTIYTSVSKYYKASFFKVYSSMALKDDLFSNESYYIVEIKSLKRILDSVEADIPVLCFVDEVLRGTNTLERIAASAQILKSFSNNNAIAFAATHDIELTHILEHYYSNYHFSEEVKENAIVFDYKLHKGRAVTKNAIKLLAMIGYKEEIITKATEQANRFLEEGSWKIL